MTSPRAVSRSRINVPGLLRGDFTGLVIGTFGAQLDFAEQHIFRQLSRSTTSRVILADHRQLTAHLAASTEATRVNRTYVACGVRSPKAHHPKFILLAGPSAGRLIVGSGNLSIGGYAGPGECFGYYDWDQVDDASALPFGAVRELIDGLATRGWLDDTTESRLRNIFQAAPWIPRTAAGQGPVVHNLERPLLDQLAHRIEGRSVNEVIASAPFHDHGAHALRQVIDRLKPERLTLLVQNGQTRLNKQAVEKLSRRGRTSVEFLDASAPQPYPNVLLHAKFMLIRTDIRDHLLAGSANLSAVALCESGSSANVELSNLLEGERGAFDHLLEDVDLVARPDGLTSFVANEEWGTDEATADWDGPLNVTWTLPELRGTFDAPCGPLSLAIAGTSVAVESEAWSNDDDGARFTLHLGRAAADRVDGARSLELSDDQGRSWTVYPYHLNTLIRLSALGRKAELIEHVGDLDLRDKELEELVAELERVLVVDAPSLWRAAHPDAPAVAEDTDEEHVRYEDLDWDRIGKLAAAGGASMPGAGAALVPLEMSVVLQALTNRFRLDAAGSTAFEPTDETDGMQPSEVGVQSDPDDPDAGDEEDLIEPPDLEDGEPTAVRRLPAATRVRRMWANFVRKFARGIADDGFVTAAGSAIIVPTYAVMNHLCRRLRITGFADPDLLTDLQIGFWRFMWGDEDRPGYLASLPDDERIASQRVLAQHDDLPLTLAAIDDAWWHLYTSDLDCRQLRDTLRVFLTNEYWTPQPRALEVAASVAAEIDGDGAALLDDLLELVNHTEETELRRAVATLLHVQPLQVVWKSDSVIRSKGLAPCEYLDVRPREMTPTIALQLLSLWHSYADRLDYLRIRSENAVAWIDFSDTTTPTYIELETGNEVPLPSLVKPDTPWARRLHQLVTAA